MAVVDDAAGEMNGSLIELFGNMPPDHSPHFQAVGCLAQRVPKLLGGRTDIARLFFKGEYLRAYS